MSQLVIDGGGMQVIQNIFLPEFKISQLWKDCEILNCQIRGRCESESINQKEVLGKPVKCENQIGDFFWDNVFDLDN